MERNGYALAFPGFATIAHPRQLMLDPSNAEIGRLASGFTAFAWVRFDDLDPSRWVYPVGMFHESDSVFFGFFGGVHGGFQSGSSVGGVVSSLGINASCWHHYVQSWNQTTGEIRFYIDGVPLARAFVARCPQIPPTPPTDPAHTAHRSSPRSQRMRRNRSTALASAQRKPRKN
jgi:hypothetical protein